jgi:hypothetical protein
LNNAFGAMKNFFSRVDYYCPPIEAIQDEVVRRGQFNLIHHESGIKVDSVLLKKSAFSDSEFGRKRKVELFSGFEVFIASPEDIILKKLDYYREGESEKHLTDIRTILSDTKTDENYLKGWVAELGLQTH